jgi:hypothetical protein
MRLKAPPPSKSTNFQKLASSSAEFIASSQRRSRYNYRMQFAIFAMRVLETMFFVGLVGSTVVVLISFVEDGKELFGKDE